MLYFFFFNDTATTEIYTLSLHDALPIFLRRDVRVAVERRGGQRHGERHQRLALVRPAGVGLALRPERVDGDEHDEQEADEDRKSTRLNSSHANISYAVFCLKKKKSK